jgi:hypothetical protein
VVPWRDRQPHRASARGRSRNDDVGQIQAAGLADRRSSTPTRRDAAARRTPAAPSAPRPAGWCSPP